MPDIAIHAKQSFSDTVENPRPQKHVFLTVTRDDLTRMTREIVSSIETGFLTDPKNPVLVAVIGGYRSGKSLIADTAHETLLQENVTFSGAARVDEYRCGLYKGHMIEVDFVNLISEEKYSSSAIEPPRGFFRTRIFGNLGQQRHVLKNFLPRRQHGGISFLQNGDPSDYPHDIEIFIQSPHDAHERINEESRIHRYPALRGEFYSMVNKEAFQWARLVDITVKNTALLKSPQFMEALQKLGPA